MGRAGARIGPAAAVGIPTRSGRDHGRSRAGHGRGKGRGVGRLPGRVAVGALGEIPEAVDDDSIRAERAVMGGTHHLVRRAGVGLILIGRVGAARSGKRVVLHGRVDRVGDVPIRHHVTAVSDVRGEARHDAVDQRRDRGPCRIDLGCPARRGRGRPRGIDRDAALVLAAAGGEGAGIGVGVTERSDGGGRGGDGRHAG